MHAYNFRDRVGFTDVTRGEAEPRGAGGMALPYVASSQAQPLPPGCTLAHAASKDTQWKPIPLSFVPLGG